MTTTLALALSLASRGWHVFPVQPAPGKAPLGGHGFKDATTNGLIVSKWWIDHPKAQIGVACGESGLLVVDLDERPQQFTSGKASLDQLGIDADSACNLVMRTPTNGGLQLFFQARDTRRQIGVMPGIDLLGDGGYTIVPSPASPGRSWLHGDPLDEDDLEVLPEWVTRLCGKSTPRSTAPSVDVKEMPIDVDQVAEIEAALAHIPNDDRGVWIKMGMALRSTGAGEQAFDLWGDWSSTSGKYNANDQRYQWDRLDVLRMDGSEITLASLFFLAKENGYGQTEVEIITPSAGGANPPESRAEGSEAPGSSPDSPGANPGGGTSPTPKTSLLARDKVDLIDWEDVAQLPPIEWQVEGLIPRASLTCLAGDTEAGKSFALIDLAMRMVHGLPFCGLPVEPGSVIYLAGEGQHGMAARFRAWEKHHAHLNLDKGDRYCVVSSEIPVLSKTTMDVLDHLVEKVIKWKGHAPAMVIIDTLSQGLDDDENESSVVAPVVRGLMGLRKRYTCSIMLAHHLVKMQQQGKKKAQEPTKDSIRGSGALTRNIDTVIGLISSDDGPRIFNVWKQKDGSKVEPIEAWLVPVLTGRERAGGEPETSCILVPDSEFNFDEPEIGQVTEDPTKPNPHAIAEHEAAIEKVVATMIEDGAVEGEGSKGAMSGNEITGQLGMKRDKGRAAVQGAARRNLIKNVGNDRSPLWLVTKSEPKQPEPQKPPK